MPEDDPLIDLGLRVTFVVDARPADTEAFREHWESNADVRKISLEVFMARNFLLGLSQLVYFSDDEQAQRRAILRNGGLWGRSNRPSELAIQTLLEGKPLDRLFREIDVNDNELRRASSYLTFEVDEILIGNSIRARANVKGRRSHENKRESWTKTLKAIATAIAAVVGAAAGRFTIGHMELILFPTYVSAAQEQGRRPSLVDPTSPKDPTRTDVYQDSRYNKIVEDLMHPNTCKFAVEEIQELLRELRFNSGPPDGIPGGQFKRAVAEFKNMKQVFPMSDDWRDRNFIYRLVEEIIRSERQESDKINLEPPFSG